MALRFLPFSTMITVVLCAVAIGHASSASAAPTTIGTKAFAKPPGSFYATLPDGTKLPLTGLKLAFGATTAGAKAHVNSLSMTVGDADATAFLKDAIAHAVVRTLAITSPKVVLTLANVEVGGFTQNGSATDFAFSAQKVSITPVGSGKTFTADTNVATHVEATPGKPSSAIPTPSLTLASIGTLGLISDTFSVSHPVDIQTGLATGKGSSKISASFGGSDGFALAGASLDNLTFDSAILKNSAGVFTVRNLQVGTTAAVFDASGTPTVTSDLTFSVLTTQTAAAPPDAGNAKLKLVLPGSPKATTIALVSAEFGVARPTSGLVTGKVQNSASFTVADSSAMPFIADVLTNKVLRSLTVDTPDATITLTNAALGSGSDTSGATGGSAKFTVAFQSIAVTVNGRTTTDADAAAIGSASAANSEPPVAASVRAPNITFANIGTLPLASETFSTITPTAAAGAATAKTQSTYAFAIAGAASLPLWQAARLGTSLGTAHVKLASIAYDFKLAAIVNALVDLDQNGATTLHGTLAFATVAISNDASTTTAQRPNSAAAGPLSVTYGDATSATHSATLLGANVHVTHGSGSSVGTAELTLPLASATDLLQDALIHAAIREMKLTAPQSTVVFTNGSVTKTAQSADTAVITLSFEKLSVSSNGHVWDATFVGAGSAAEPVVSTSGETASVPYLSSSKLGTLALASESVSQQTPTDATTGLPTGKSVDSAELVSAPASAIALFEVLGSSVIPQVGLTTTSSVFTLKNVAAIDVTMSYAQSGAPSTDAHVRIQSVAIATKTNS